MNRRNSAAGSPALACLRTFLGCMLALASSAAAGHTALPPDTLARVGARIITATDLVERIEMMPWPGKRPPGGLDSAKIQALESLVAEELLAIRAAGAGLADDSVVLELTRDTERLLVRDELHRRQVREGIAISATELETGLSRYGRRRQLLAVVTTSESEAGRLSRLLAQSANHDTVIRGHAAAAILRIDTATVTLGDTEEEFENLAFSLEPGRRASGPQRSSGGEWFVLYLLGESRDPQAHQSTPDEARHYVHELLRRREEVAGARQYLAEVLSTQRARVDPELFALLTGTLLDAFHACGEGCRGPQGYLINRVVDTASVILREFLPREFVHFEGGALTLGELLSAYHVMNFTFPTLTERDFQSRLSGTIKEVTAAELMTQEGYRQNLQHSPEVRHALHSWQRYWLAGTLRRRIEITVTQEDVLAALVSRGSKLGEFYEVNVREILSKDRLESVRLLERLRIGSFPTLARTHSLRAEWARRDGESGFFRASEHPEIGFRALAAEEGELLGPIELPEGYSIFGVLGKRTVAGSAAPSFDSLTALVAEELRHDLLQDSLDNLAAAQAHSTPVRIDYERLRGIAITRASTVTRRAIGFGGTMTAFPPLLPQTGWVEKLAGQVLP